MSCYGDYDDQAFIADLYDLISQYASRPDSKFYAEFCRGAGGKVLELGCGTGRVLVKVAEVRCKIVGLDLPQHMLAKCRERLATQPEAIQNRIKLVQANMTNFDLREKFSAIIIPFRSSASGVPSGSIGLLAMHECPFADWRDAHYRFFSSGFQQDHGPAPD